MASDEKPPQPHLEGRFADALVYTSELHRDQSRKTRGDEAPGVSYLGHLLGVASIVIDAGGTEDMAIGALLHDAAEDQGGEATLDAIGERFGGAVEGIVRDCSDWLGDGEKPPWLERKRDYVRRLPGKPAPSQLVSLADKLYNARAIRLDLDAASDSAEVWDRFNADAPAVAGYYEALADAFCEASRQGELGELGGRPLADELFRTAAEISATLPGGARALGADEPAAAS